MVKLDRAIRDEGFAARMLLQVHDDLLFELPTDELDGFATMARRLMTTAVPLHVPLAVDAKAGPNWPGDLGEEGVSEEKLEVREEGEVGSGCWGDRGGMGALGLTVVLGPG